MRTGEAKSNIVQGRRERKYLPRLRADTCQGLLTKKLLNLDWTIKIERRRQVGGNMSRQERNSVRSDIMVEEGWVDTLKKEVIEYTVDRDRHKEMLSVFENVRTVLQDIIDRVDADNSLKNFSDAEIKYLKRTLKQVEKLVGRE